MLDSSLAAAMEPIPFRLVLLVSRARLSNGRSLEDIGAGSWVGLVDQVMLSINLSADQIKTLWKQLKQSKNEFLDLPSSNS